MLNPAILSKINWTQVVGFVAMALTLFGFNLEPDDQVKIVAGIGAIQSVATIIFRTFFTGKPA
jgi:hypothetical protein